MSIEQLQQSIDGAAQAIDGRYARDAETIRQLLSVCRNLVNAVELLHSGPQAYIAYQSLCVNLVSEARAAVARADGK